MKTLIQRAKRVFTESTKVALGIVIGISLVVAGSVYAALDIPGNVSSGDIISSASWNKILDALKIVDQRTEPITNAEGNIGIGTTTPTEKLEVSGNTKLKTNTGNAELQIQSGEGNTHWGVYQDQDSADLSFWNGGNRLTVKNEGGMNVDGKISSSSTQDSDPGNVVATKDYVDAQSEGGGSIVGGGGAECEVICNGTCAPAPAGWQMTQSNGASGASSYGAGRCAHTSGSVETLCCYFATSNPVSPQNRFFVLTQGSWNGNLGGLEGANQKCLDDLTEYGWTGKDRVGELTADNVRAFLCDSEQCNNLTPNATYSFAVSGNMNFGGSTLTTDSFGRGPSDSSSWSGGSYFGQNVAYWSGRGTVTESLWSTEPHKTWNARSNTHYCMDWTNDTNYDSTGSIAYSNESNRRRWDYPTSNQYCPDTNIKIVCIVN
jgi:hypothetical protein